MTLSHDSEKAEDKGTAERVINRVGTELNHHKNRQSLKKANKEIREHGQSPRLQFSKDEYADPDLSQYIRKSDKAADRLEKARSKIPKQKRIELSRTFDEATGKSKVRLHFAETDKKPVGKMHPRKHKGSPCRPALWL